MLLPSAQTLMRQSFKANNLEPFHEASVEMQRTDHSDKLRANYYKAIRFGLVGVVATGWQQNIVAPQLDEHGIVSYDFTSTKHFPAHEAALIDERTSTTANHITTDTQGSFLLRRILSGLHTSMEEYVDPSNHSKIHGIDINDTISALTANVNLAVSAGIHKVPDKIVNGLGQQEALFTFPGTATIEEDVCRTLTTTARNPIRFSITPIKRLMKHLLPLRKLAANLAIAPKRSLCTGHCALCNTWSRPCDVKMARLLLPK